MRAVPLPLLLLPLKSLGSSSMPMMGIVLALLLGAMEAWERRFDMLSGFFTSQKRAATTETRGGMRRSTATRVRALKHEGHTRVVGQM